jgi:hypothetical protein
LGRRDAGAPCALVPSKGGHLVDRDLDGACLNCEDALALGNVLMVAAWRVLEVLRVQADEVGDGVQLVIVIGHHAAHLHPA